MVRNYGHAMSRRVLGAVIAGAIFGALVSLVNAASSPFTSTGASLVGTALALPLQALSQVIGIGWAWAALAVIAGWWARALVRSGAAGALALLGAVVTYYMGDSVLLDQPITDFAGELLLWSAAAVVIGAPLGVVGALTHRRGLVGLMAALVVPVGAAAQLLVVDPLLVFGEPSRPGALGAAVGTLMLVLGVSVAALVRFLRQRTTAAHRATKVRRHQPSQG